VIGEQPKKNLTEPRNFAGNCWAGGERGKQTEVGKKLLEKKWGVGTARE